MSKYKATGKEREIHHCVICDEMFLEYPCSARPLLPGDCCPRCDDLIVTTIRMITAVDQAQGALAAEMMRRAIDMRNGKRELMERMREQRGEHKSDAADAGVSS